MLGTIKPLTSILKQTEHLFIARGFEPRHSIPSNPEESIELIRLPFEEGFQMIVDGMIFHGPSVATILKAHATMCADSKARKLH